MNRIVVEILIERESDDSRLEHYANDIAAALEQRPVLDTHRTADLGSDGRTRSGETQIHVASSYRSDWRTKFRQDATRLAKTLTHPGTVYFVTTQPVTEKEFRKLEPDLVEILPSNVSIVTLGLSQLVDFALDHEDIFQRHYAAVYSDFVRELNASIQTAPAATDKLRLALATIGAPDSHAVRTQLYSQGLLLALSRDASLSVTQLAKQFSEMYRVAGQVADAPIKQAAELLISAGFATNTDGRYRITAAGLKELESALLVSVQEERIGRSVVRKRIEESIGYELTADQFDRVWTTLEKEIADYFNQRGQTFVSFILALTDPERSHDIEDEEAFIKSIAQRVADTTTFSPLSDELFTAVEDLFWERQSPAHEWLADLCVGYVMVCTLGFERDVRDEVVAVLRKCALVLDTDVVLTLLCEGEPDHEALNDVLRRWRQLGAAVYVAAPVIQEAAYHAVIARRDYDEVEHLLPGTVDDRQRLIDNAFVRAFAAHLASGTAKKSNWEGYINQFAPRRSRSSRPVLPEAVRAIESVLGEEFQVRLLPPPSDSSRALVERVFAFLESRPPKNAEGRALSNYLDKSRRDSELYASLVQAAKAQREDAADSAMILVSSARRLGYVERKFTQMGERQLVVPPSAVLYLLTVVPDVTIARPALRNFLFDPVRRRFTSNVEKVVLRAVREASVVDLPFGRRTPLMRKLRDSVLEQGNRNADVADQRLVSQPELLPRRVADALHQLSLDSPLARDHRHVLAENEQLRARLETALTKLRNPPNRGKAR